MIPAFELADKALQEAFSDAVRKCYETCVGNVASGMSVDSAITKFSKGLGDIKAIHEKAGPQVTKVFGV